MKRIVVILGLASLSGCSNTTEQPPANNGSLTSQTDTMRSIQIQSGIRQRGQVSDADLDWLLGYFKNEPQPLRVAIMVRLSKLTQPSQSQKEKIKSAIKPYLNSQNAAEKKAAEKVQSSMG